MYIFLFIILFFIYFIGIFLHTFRQVNLFGKTWVIIIYKIFDYGFLLTLIILEYIYDSKYYNSGFDNNLFICLKEYISYMEFSFLDIIFRIINQLIFINYLIYKKRLNLTKLFYF